jgi:cerevisin
MRSFLALSLLPLIASASPVFHTGTIHDNAAPILSSSNAKEIPDSYIVVFKKHVSESSALAHHGWVQDLHLSNEDSIKMELRKRSQAPFVSDFFSGLKHTYNIAGGLMGYSGHFDEKVIEEVRRHPDVSHPNVASFESLSGSSWPETRPDGP